MRMNKRVVARLHIFIVTALAASIGLAACSFPEETAEPAAVSGGEYRVAVTWRGSGTSFSKGLTDDASVASVSVLVLNSSGAQIGSGELANGASGWTGDIVVSETGLVTLKCRVKDGAGVLLYWCDSSQTITGEDDAVTLATMKALTVTYDANGGSGTVPTAVPGHFPEDAVTVSINTGSVALSGYVFTGWNTAADGGGTDYAEESTLTFGESDVTLYAKWISTSILTVSGTSITGSNTSYNGALMIPYGITTIEQAAFVICTGLTSVTLPSSLTSIGANAFANCTGLTSVTLSSDLTSIASEAFTCCTSLLSVTIPSKVTDIGMRAFLGCTSLASVTIQPGVAMYIEDSAFRTCNLTSLTLPSRVSIIGGSAFAKNANLSTVKVESTQLPYLYDYTTLFEYCASGMVIYVPSASLSLYQLSGWGYYTLSGY